MFEQIGGMRSWPTPAPSRQQMGPAPISGFAGQFSGLMPEEIAADAQQAAAWARAQRIARLSSELGIPQPTAAWLIEQESKGPKALREALGARSSGFARALEARGALPAASDVAGAPLGEILAQTGEVREDPLNRALRSLNRKIAAEGGGTFVGGDGYERDLESGAIVDRATADPTERPIDAGTLSADELAALMPASERATVLPFAVEALSPAEKKAAFQDSGASRTRASQRNALAKEPNTGFEEQGRDLYPGTTTLRSRRAGGVDSDDRYTWFTPGNVLGTGMEPSPRGMTIPLLVSPLSQERSDVIGEFQTPSVHLKSTGSFVPALGDVRILDINPLAQLSPAAADALGARLGESFYTSEELDKSETGGYAGRATNAPIPDPATGGGGFDPTQDPATSRSGVMATTRPMTVAEAAAKIAMRNRAPISPVLLSQLRNNGGEAMLLVTPPVGERYEVPVYPLGMPGPGEEKLSPFERLQLQARARGADFVDARIGSMGRYGSGFRPDINALIGVLASEAFPDARARFQLQATASGLDGQPVTVGNPYRPLAVERPVGSDWALLMNNPRQDDLISGYQQRLLAQAGIELPADRNQMFSLVDMLQSLAGVPAADVPMQAAAPAAQRVMAMGGGLEMALQQAKMRGNSSVRSQLIPSDAGAAAFPPDTSAFERKAYEDSARATLAGLLSGRIELPSPSVAQPPAREPGLPNAWISERTAVSPGGPSAPVESDSGNPYSRQAADAYLAQQIALRATPARALAGRASQGWIPGLEAPYSANLYTPDPIDDVARELRRRAEAAAEERRALGEVRVIGPDPVYQPTIPQRSSQAAAPAVAAPSNWREILQEAARRRARRG